MPPVLPSRPTASPVRLATRGSRLPSRGGYWRVSRAPRYSVLFAFPLLLLYEALAAVLTPSTGGVRNGADVWIRSILAIAAGPWAPLALGALLVGGGAALVIVDARRHGWRVQPRVFAGMMAESVLLALLFGGVVAAATASVLDTLTLSVPPVALQTGGAAAAGAASFGGATWLMLSLGAGLYEELMFRVLIVSGLGWLLTRGLGWRTGAAMAAAIATSALVFAAAHYVGPLGDAWAIESFTFRLIAGLALSGLYAARGFGIAAWTHALYDVWVGVG